MGALYSAEFWDWDWSLATLAGPSFMLPVIVGVLLRRFYRRTHRVILCFTGYNLLMDYLSQADGAASLFSTVTNSPIYHLLTPGLVGLLTWLYRPVVFVGRYRWLATLICIAFTVFAIINALYIDGFYNFPSNAAMFYALYGIALSLSYFAVQLYQPTVLRLEKSPLFWVSVGMLPYYATSLLIWFAFEQIYVSDAFGDVFGIARVATIFLNLTCIIALAQSRYPQPVPLDTQSVRR